MVEYIGQDGYGRDLPEYRQRSLQNSFMAANQAAVTFGVGLGTDMATFALHNPTGSGKNLIVRAAKFCFSAAPAAAVTVWLCAGLNATAPATTTPITVRNAILANATAGVGVVYSQATLAAAPIIIRPLISIVGAVSLTPGQIFDRIDGDIIVAPATQLIFQASAACAGFCSLSWEEITAW